MLKSLYKRRELYLSLLMCFCGLLQVVALVSSPELKPESIDPIGFLTLVAAVVSELGVIFIGMRRLDQGRGVLNVGDGEERALWYIPTVNLAMSMIASLVYGMFFLGLGFAIANSVLSAFLTRSILVRRHPRGRQYAPSAG